MNSNKHIKVAQHILLITIIVSFIYDQPIHAPTLCLLNSIPFNISVDKISQILKKEGINQDSVLKIKKLYSNLNVIIIYGNGMVKVSGFGKEEGLVQNVNWIMVCEDKKKIDYTGFLYFGLGSFQSDVLCLLLWKDAQGKIRSKRFLKLGVVGACDIKK